jgi:single-strand DNA-binding protein
MSSRNLNKVMLIGNLTRDPEMRYTPQGNAVASFVVATNREWMSNGERKQAADFHNAVAWNKLAEICGQLLRKGTKVYVEGRLQTRDWVGDDGRKRYKTEIVVDDMILLKSPGGSDGESSVGFEPRSSDKAADVEAPKENATSDMELDLADLDLDSVNFDDLGDKSSEEGAKDKSESEDKA